MMEAARTSETSVDNHFTRQYNPEDSSEHHVRKYVYCNLVGTENKKTTPMEVLNTHKNTHLVIKHVVRQ
jgi:hypothetical protein